MKKWQLYKKNQADWIYFKKHSKVLNIYFDVREEPEMEFFDQICILKSWKVRKICKMGEIEVEAFPYYTRSILFLGKGLKGLFTYYVSQMATRDHRWWGNLFCSMCENGQLMLTT